MEWIEADPLPPACQEEDCYNCDHAGERWTLSQADELRKGLMKAIERLQRQVKAIDAELEGLENG